MIKMLNSQFKRVLISIIVATIFFLCWRTGLKDRINVMEEIAVENSEGEFIATFDTVHYIVACNNDVKYEKVSDLGMINISIQIIDENANVVYYSKADNISIHTNGYTSIESGPIMTEEAANLRSGHVYKMVYSATLSSGEKLDNISFILYGAYRSTNKISFLLMTLLFLAVCIAIWSDNIDLKKSVILWLILISVSIVFIPLLQSKDELNAFSDVYATSSLILGRSAVDDNGYIIIEESGIRNNGWLSYSHPLFRFWTDRSYGDSGNESKISSLYMVSKWIINPSQIPALIGVTIARALKMHYSYIYICGWLMQLIVFISIILYVQFEIKMRVCDENGQSIVVMTLILIPSMLLGALSYTGFGIVVALSFLFATLIYNDGMELSFYNKIAATIVLFIIIFCEPALVIYSYFLYKQIKRKLVFVPIASIFFIGIWNTTSVIVPNASAIKTFYCNIDNWIQQMSVYHYNTTDGMVITVFNITLLIILMIGRNCRVEWNYRIRVILFLISSIILIVTDSNVSEGICGEKWIPIYLVLFCSMGNKNNAFSITQSMKTMQKLVLLCSCIVIFMRYRNI